MVAKFKSKTHFLKTFFYFWYRYQKMQNFMLISNPQKNFLKNAQKKSYKHNKIDEYE